MALEKVKKTFGTLGLLVLSMIGSSILPFHIFNIPLLTGILFFISAIILFVNNFTDYFDKYSPTIPLVSLILILIGGRLSPALAYNFITQLIAGIAIFICVLLVADFLNYKLPR